MPTIASLTPVIDLKDDDKVPLVDEGVTKTTPLANLKYDFFNLQSDLGAVRDEMGSGDRYINNVSLLLHGDGVNNAQNNTFLDSSTNNFTITRNGTPTQGSFSPYNDNWSNYFNGSTDYLSVPDNDAFHLTGDFTIEAWVYQTSSKDATIIGQWGNPGVNQQSYIFRIETNGKLSFAYADSPTTGVNSTPSSSGITYNSWNHVAFVRSGNTVRYYINGVQDSVTNTVSISFINASYPHHIGLTGSAAGTHFNGYISNLRFVKGTALYTSNFTPPTSNLTAVAGTSLLTCQSNTFKDNSSNNFTITANGTPSVSLESPFKSTSAYSPSVNGGSGYFNGTTDYLTNYTSGAATATTFGTQNFTIEAWVNFNSATGNQGICDASNQIGIGTAVNQFFLYKSTTGLAFGSHTTGNLLTYNWTPVVGTWYHVAVSRSGTSLKMFINGVEVASATNSTNFTGSGINIGVVATPYYFNGYISNLRITKGAVGAALYTSNFTPPTSPVTLTSNGGATPSTAPTSGQVSLLCDFTNAGIIDHAKKNNLTTIGDAKVSTSVKKYGSGSIYFDGTGDYLDTPVSSLWAFPTNSTFTIECWINTPQKSDETNCILSIYNTTKNDQLVIRTQSGNLEIYTNNGGQNNVVAPIAANTWTHIAISGTLPNLKAFINGQQYNITLASSFTTGGARCVVGGMLVAYSTKSYYYIGYIDDLRITKGVARYTANFTPPARAFPDNFGGIDLTGTYKWFGGVLAPNGKIYGIPSSSTSVLVIDPVANTTSTFGSLGTGDKWAGGVLAPNGKIYGIPSSSTSVVIVDPVTNTTSTFGSLGAGEKWYGGVLAPNGKIYCIPYSSTSVLIIDPSTNTTSTFGSLTGTIKWVGGVLAPNGKIYGIPYGSTSVLIIDPVTNTTSTFGSLTGDLDKWCGGTLAPNGKIYGTPFQSTDILQITPDFNPASYVPLELCTSAYYNKF